MKTMYKKLLIPLALLFSFSVPFIALAAYTTYQTTNPTATEGQFIVDHNGYLTGTSTPTGGVGTSTNPFIASYFVATSTTATSSLADGLNLTHGCYAIGGSCLSTSGGGTNYLTNAGATTTLNLGSILSAGSFYATSTSATSVFNGNAIIGGQLNVDTDSLTVGQNGMIFQAGDVDDSADYATFQTNGSNIYATTNGVFYAGTGLGTDGQVAMGSSTSITNGSTLTIGQSNLQIAKNIDVLGPNGQDYFNVSLGGNVGIGTSTPWAPLSVVGNSDLGTNALAGYFTGTSTAVSTFGGTVSATNIIATTTGLATSGSNFGSGLIVVGGSAWSSGAPYQYDQDIHQTFSGSNSILTFSPNTGVFFNNTNTYRFSAINSGLEAVNASGGLGFRFMDTYNTAYMGTTNTSGSTVGVVPAGGWAMQFAIATNGELGSIIPITGNNTPTWRNVLDDGSGNMTITGNVGIGTTSPYARLSVMGANAQTAPLFDIATSSGADVTGWDSSGHHYTSGPAPTISSCGTGSPTVTGDDSGGTITTGSAATSCTLTFAKAYASTPYPSGLSDNSAVITVGVSSISTSAVTFSLSGAGLTGGQIYYSIAYHK